MRTQTDKEKAIFGCVEVIFRNMHINRNTEGYVPLVDATAYAYTFPEEDLAEVINLLSKENYYVGVGWDDVNATTQQEKICSAIVHTVKTAIEHADNEYLKALELDGLDVILKGKTGTELEKVLLNEIGDKYAMYSNNEKITFFFIRRIIKAIRKKHNV